LDPALEHVMRGALALLLGAGAVAKLRDRVRFRAAVEAYEIVPAPLAGAAALAFAALEGALAIALLAPAGLGVRSVALLGAATLFGVYGAAIATNLARGRTEIDCGCGGGVEVPLSGWLLLRNGLLIAAALACLGGATPRPLGWVDALSIGGGLAVLALAWSASHGLLAYDAVLRRMQEDV
jgi:hypothetical protein